MAMLNNQMVITTIQYIMSHLYGTDLSIHRLAWSNGPGKDIMNCELLVQSGFSGRWFLHLGFQKDKLMWFQCCTTYILLKLFNQYSVHTGFRPQLLRCRSCPSLQPLSHQAEWSRNSHLFSPPLHGGVCLCPQRLLSHDELVKKWFPYGIPSGKQPHSYWKSPFIVSFRIKNADVP